MNCLYLLQRAAEGALGIEFRKTSYQFHGDVARGPLIGARLSLVFPRINSLSHLGWTWWKGGGDSCGIRNGVFMVIEGNQKTRFL